MTYFAGFHLNTGSAVMITGSHNPPDYNGIKSVIQATRWRWKTFKHC